MWSLQDVTFNCKKIFFSNLSEYTFKRYLLKRRATWNDLKRSETTYKEQETTWNDLQRPTTSRKQSETTYNVQETTWNDPQRVRNNLQWPEHTYNEQRKDAKRTRRSRFSDYFTIWGKQFSSLTRFPPNIWLQSFEYCFMENHGENRASSIYYHAWSVNYHVYFCEI